MSAIAAVDQTAGKYPAFGTAGLRHSPATAAVACRTRTSKLLRQQGKTAAMTKAPEYEKMWAHQISEVVGAQAAIRIIDLARINGLFDPNKDVERLRAALRECEQLAGRLGPPNEIDACNEIERVAKAALTGG